MPGKFELAARIFVSSARVANSLHVQCSRQYSVLQQPPNRHTSLSYSSAELALTERGNVPPIEPPRQLELLKNFPTNAPEILQFCSSLGKISVPRQNIKMRPIDPIRDCVIEFSAAAAVVAVKFQLAADLRMEKAKAEKQPIEQEFTIKEIMDFSKEYMKVLNSFHQCLTRKRPPEDLESTLLNKSKDFMKVLIKYSGERWKLKLKSHTLEMIDEINRKRAFALLFEKKLDDQYNQYVAQIEQLNSNIDHIVGKAEEAQKAVSVAFKGLTRLYAEIIKNGEGAAVMNPSVVKALESFTTTGDEKHLKTAKDALEAQLKKAKSGTKLSKVFVADMEELIKAL
jgi:hypothetical protein